MIEDIQTQLGNLVAWLRRKPVEALLFALVLGIAWFFFFHLRVYSGLTLFRWAWGRFEPEYNFEHGKLVPWIFLFLIWHHRKALQEAPKGSSKWGLVVVVLGCLFYALGARTLQGRVGMFAMPFLFYGSVLYLWGRHVARILLFPAAFLIFMIPVAAIEQATFRLQFVITGIANAFCNIIGMKLYSVGTTLRAVDESFGFEIAEGCSGIRSLMAMAMLTAVFVHLTQDRLWKKLLIFAFSIIFAIIGNAGRIVTILLMAKFIDPKLAGGLYHDYSAFIFFPVALLSMLGFSKLVNADYRAMYERLSGPGSPDGKADHRDRVSYDY